MSLTRLNSIRNTATQPIHNNIMFMQLHLLWYQKFIACHFNWHLTFLGRHWESKELSLDKISETWHWLCGGLWVPVPVLCKRQQLVPGARTFKLNDLIGIQVPKAHQVFGKVYDGAKSSQRGDAEQHWSIAMVKSMDLQATLPAISVDLEGSCGNTLVFGGVPKAECWLLFQVQFLQSRGAIVLVVELHQALKCMDRSYVSGGTTIENCLSLINHLRGGRRSSRANALLIVC